MRHIAVFVAALSIGSAFTLGTHVQSAYACPETGVFWNDTDTSGNPLTNTSGSWQSIGVHDHQLICVTTEAGAGQTARILLGAQPGRWVEVGWMLKWCGSSHCWRAFVEYGINGSTQSQTQWSFSCLGPGQTDQFKEFYNASFPTWEGDMFCGGQWWLVDSHADMYSTGVADGEAFARGSNTQEGDMGGEIHSNLQYADPVVPPNWTGVWHPVTGSAWPAGDACRLDKSSRWNGLWLGGPAFKFVSSSDPNWGTSVTESAGCPSQ